MPGEQFGLLGAARYVADVLPAPVAGIFFLGLCVCALGWGAPCQFSGATSPGRDVGSALNPAASEADLVRYTRWSRSSGRGHPRAAQAALAAAFQLVRQPPSAAGRI